MKPAYLKIHDAIKGAIDQGTWAIGKRLPSERELADTYQVSRMTLRQAVGLLVDEGLLERRVGSGTYVAGRRMQEKMRGTTSFTEIIHSQGKTPSSKLISYQKQLASQMEIEQLRLEKTDYVIKMERIRYADEVPVVYEVASIPETLIRQFNRTDITEHFFQTLRDNGYEIGKSQQTIYAKVANDHVASYLNISKGHPILALTQVSYLADNTPFEYVRSQYVGDRFEFYLENN